MWRVPSRLAAWVALLVRALDGAPADGDRYVQEVLTLLVRPGAGRGYEPNFHEIRESLVASRSFGALALLSIFGVADVHGRLQYPQGFPRDFRQAVKYAAEGVLSAGSQDGWSFTALAFLLSLDYPPLRCLRLEVLPGPWVQFKGLDEVLHWARGLDEARPRHCKRDARRGDLAGAAYWAAAELREPLGAVAFASLLRRNLTDVPSHWHGPRRSVLARAPKVLIGAAAASASADLACRALGTLIGPASSASSNEEPLLDKAALTWKAWRHRVRRLPEEPDWKETKEYVDTVRFRAEQLQEPEAQRELGAVHYEGHAEGDVQQSRETATSQWQVAAKKGDVWSAWYTALVTIQDGRPEAAHEYLDQVVEARAGALAYMAMHFKQRFGLGVPKSPEQAGLFLMAAADLGYSNAQLILAHTYMGHTHGNMEGVLPPGGVNSSMALLYYKAAAAGGRLSPKFNVALLTAQGQDPEVTDPRERCLVAYRHFSEIILRAHREVHLTFAHARRAFDLGDDVGALLRFALLSDAGAMTAHLNAAYLWDRLAADGAQGGRGDEALSCWPARGANLTACAFYYQRRAASAGHVPSMHELSVRYLEGRARLPAEEAEAEARPPEEAAFAWTALAAEQGDARGKFDLAYLLQFGIGCQEDASQAQELYEQLLHDGDWSARIAALGGLGLQRLRTYFLSAEGGAAHVAAGYLAEFGSWLAGGMSAGWEAVRAAANLLGGAAAKGASLLEGLVIHDRFQGPAAGGQSQTARREGGRRLVGRLVYQLVL